MNKKTLTEQQKQVLRESLFDKLIGMVFKGDIKKAAKAVNNDPRVVDAMKKAKDANDIAKKSLEDFCKKHGC